MFRKLAREPVQYLTIVLTTGAVGSEGLDHTLMSARACSLHLPIQRKRIDFFDEGILFVSRRGTGMGELASPILLQEALYLSSDILQLEELFKIERTCDESVIRENGLV